MPQGGRTAGVLTGGVCISRGGCKEIMAEKYGVLVLRKRGRPPSWGLFEYGIMRALYEGRPWARIHLVTVSPSLCSSVALYCSVLGR